MAKETDEEWLERMTKEVAELQERVDETSRMWQEHLESPEHHEYLESKRKLEKLVQSLTSKVKT